MEEQFQRILNKAAQKSGRSRLEPYSELIEQLRQRGLTYRDISDILTKELQVQVPKSTVNDFVRAQARERKKRRVGCLVVHRRRNRLFSYRRSRIPPRVTTRSERKSPM
jgi:hypothetical protein